MLVVLAVLLVLVVADCVVDEVVVVCKVPNQKFEPEPASASLEPSDDMATWCQYLVEPTDSSDQLAPLSELVQRFPP